VRSPFRNCRRDAWVLAASLLHGAATTAFILLASRTTAVPHALIVGAVAVGLVWASNTVAHIHLHTPLFHDGVGNRAFALYLTVTLGIPQGWWRRRHLRHHGCAASPSGGGWGEPVVVAAVWGTLLVVAPAPFLGTYLPAWALALALCAVQGHYEHAGAGADAGVDYHGPIYNRLWFNDGRHAQHHRRPEAHWTTLVAAEGRRSAWPPLLRWVEDATALLATAIASALDRLERLPLSFVTVRRFVLQRHRQALVKVLAAWEGPRPTRVCIVGGGLFPRTALLLRELLPEATLVIVDASARNVATARGLLTSAARPPITYVTACYDPDAPPTAALGADLLVVPLAYRGDRDRFYTHPPAPAVLVHEWLWRRGGQRGAVVSAWLLKRLNLVVRDLRPRPRQFDTLAEEIPWPPSPLPRLPPSLAPLPRRSSPIFARVTARRS
jgi:hypothetical protein